MFLDRLQIDHDGSDILAAKYEFRHIWMARNNTLAKSFLQGFDRVPLGESAKQRSLRMPALADAASGMAPKAIACEKSRATAEGGHVLGGSSECQEGETDTQRQQSHDISPVRCIGRYLSLESLNGWEQP